MVLYEEMKEVLGESSLYGFGGKRRENGMFVVAVGWGLRCRRASHLGSLTRGMFLRSSSSCLCDRGHSMHDEAVNDGWPARACFVRRPGG